MSGSSPTNPAIEQARSAVATHLLPRVYPHSAPVRVEVDQTPDRITPAEAEQRDFRPASIGLRWGPVWSTAWFRVRAGVPADWQGRPLALRMDTGTEALVWHRPGAAAGWQPLHGLDRNRDTVRLLDAAAGGAEIDLLVEAACNHPLGGGGKRGDPVTTSGLFWEPPEFHARWEERDPGRLERCELVVVDDDAWRLWRACEFALQTAELAGSEATRAQSLAAAVLAAIDRFTGARDAGAAWTLLTHALGGPAAAGGSLCTAIGHAHLDTAWLWPIAESRRKALRTFATAAAMLDRFGPMRFAATAAQHYQWVSEASPELFERVREHARNGRWEILGGMWVEPDGNLPSGESFIRQILHGTRWFRHAFGDSLPPSRVAFLPDTFGFAGSLPQIFRLCGFDTFITNKLWWNDATEFPHIHFRWRGIDGTEILSHLTPGKEYNAANTPAELARGERTLREKDHAGIGCWLQPFGYGDGGGGPTDWMLLNAQLSSQTEGLPRVEVGTVASFAQALHIGAAQVRRADLPVMDGELYLQKHRGTYTTQARTKRDNACGEAMLRAAEWLAVAAEVESASVRERLDRAWKLTLTNQFHDILPGSSIGAVYDQAASDSAEARSICRSVIDGALARVAAATDTRAMRSPRLVVNPGSAARSAWIGGAFAAGVPAMGFAVVDAAAPGAVQPVTASGRRISNGLLDVEIDPCGRVTRLVHLASGRDVVGGPSTGGLNDLALYEDHPQHWDAWELDRDYESRRVVESLKPSDFKGDNASVMDGCAILSVARPLGAASSITQRFTLRPGSPRLDIHTTVDWHEDHRILRALFPTASRAEHVTCEIPFGHIRRPTTRNTPEEAAMFEFPAHRWIDLSEPGRGLALLNDGIYGHSCRGGVVGLSLLRSPTWPDPNADRGVNEFTYSLMPHSGDWRAAGVDAEAEQMVLPMWSVPLPTSLGTPSAVLTPSPVSITCTDGAAVRIAAIKPAEDATPAAVVLRIVESHGRAGRCEVRWNLPVSAVQPVAPLETPMELDGFRHDMAAAKSGFPVRPFQIVTLLAIRRT